MSSQYLLADNGEHAEIGENPALRLDGDFAAGCRDVQSSAGAHGGFATGLRSTPLFMTVGDFATGLHTRPAADSVCGDFATGQRNGRSQAAIRHVQPAHRGLSRLWQKTLRSA